MRIPDNHHIRTFAEEKIGVLGDMSDHIDEVNAFLNDMGFTRSKLSTLVSTPYHILKDPETNAHVLITTQHRRGTEPKIGNSYVVIGPEGLADNVIESIRSISLRNRYQEVSPFNDIFSNI